MNLKLINARDAKNNLYYGSDLYDIMYLLDAGSRLQKREIAQALFKRKVSADEIKEVLDFTEQLFDRIRNILEIDKEELV